MTTTTFVAGQNAPLDARTVRFRATARSPIDLCALVVDERLRVASTDDVAFYNQPAIAGVRLDGAEIEIDLDALRAGAHAVLCVAAADGAGAIDGLASSLALGSADDVHLPAEEARPASICWELYRRGAGWKVRAVGQGYDGGLAELLTAHGVELESGSPGSAATPSAAAASAPAPAPNAPPAPQGTPPSAVTAPATSVAAPDPSSVPLQQEFAFERLMSIFEDASRSVAAHTAATAFAAQRREQELSDALADPAARFGPAGDAARAQAETRHDELVAEARRRLDADHATLSAEVRALDPQLPAPLASWESPSWRRATTVTDGVRVGELLTTQSPLRVPMCVHVPMHRPLWLDGASRVISPAALALTLRFLALDPEARVELLDPTGDLGEVAEACAPMLAAPPARTPEAIADRLRSVFERADRAVMSAQAGLDEAPAPLVVVLGDVSDDLDEEVLTTLFGLMERAPEARVSILLTGDTDEQPRNPGVAVLDDVSTHLPVTGPATIEDPWVGTPWEFAIDLAPFDPADRTRIVEDLSRPRER